jgi:pre-mRNA-processing factor 17
MSALVAGYESSDDEVQPTNIVSTADAVEDDESDDEELEEQARTDAFGLKDGEGVTKKAKSGNGKVVVASAPDVLREVCLTCTGGIIERD